MRRKGWAKGREWGPGREPGGTSRAGPPTIMRNGRLKVPAADSLLPTAKAVPGGLTRLRIEPLLVLLITRS